MKSHCQAGIKEYIFAANHSPVRCPKLPVLWAPSPGNYPPLNLRWPGTGGQDLMKGLWMWWPENTQKYCTERVSFKIKQIRQKSSSICQYVNNSANSNRDRKQSASCLLRQFLNCHYLFEAAFLYLLWFFFLNKQRAGWSVLGST